MKNRLTVVDGTGQDRKAPRPKYGLARALYEVVDACGGATFEQIVKYLPAAIIDAKQVASRKKIAHNLYHCVYRGYLVHQGEARYKTADTKGHWFIAPLSYYNARQQYLDDLKSSSKPRVRNSLIEEHMEALSLETRDDRSASVPGWVWPLMALVGIGMFGLGLIAGLLI